MVQKLAIVILALALLIAISGIYLYVTKGDLPFLSKKTEMPAPEPVKVAETPISVSTSTKPMPTEEEIGVKIESVMKVIKIEGSTRRLTTKELDYLNDPRASAIKDLTK